MDRRSPKRACALKATAAAGALAAIIAGEPAAAQERAWTSPISHTPG